MRENRDIVFRPIKESELEMIMNWRMDPEITKYMYTDPKLTMEDQKKWFEKGKTDKYNESYMIQVDGQAVGVLQITDIDRKNQRCSWGIYIAVKEVRSLELFLAIEWNIYDYAFYKLGLHKVFWEVFSLNRGVVRMHKMCGSEVEGVLKDHIYKNGKFFDITLVAICKDRWEEIKDKFSYPEIEFRKK